MNGIDEDDEMLEEYDFSDGVRGKYIERLKNAGQIVLREQDDDQVIHQTNVEKSHQP